MFAGSFTCCFFDGHIAGVRKASLRTFPVEPTVIAGAIKAVGWAHAPKNTKLIIITIIFFIPIPNESFIKILYATQARLNA